MNTKQEQTAVRYAMELSEYLKTTGMSQGQAAKELDISRATLSQFLSGKYQGDNNALADKVKNFLELSEKRDAENQATEFIPTLENTVIIYRLAQYTHQHTDFTLISGESGAGKTTALKHYAQNNPGVVFVTADTTCSTKSDMGILRLICSEVCKTTPNTKQAILNTLQTPLRGSKRLIIIDEADRLSLNSLQTVRQLNDLYGVGVLLSGNDKIYNQTITSRRSGEFSQIRTRLTIRPRVENLYSESDIMALFPLLADSAAVKTMQEIAYNESLRGAKKIYNYAVLTRPDKTTNLITARYISETMNALKGFY